MKLLIASTLVLTGMIAEMAVGNLFIDRAGCELVKEANGGPVVLVQIHSNPNVFETQFVNGTIRWECGDDRTAAY